MAPLIQTKEQLKNYILMKLGSPVVNIEITDEQLDMAITDTLDDYLPRAYSGMEERYIVFVPVPDQQDYVLPYEINSVLSVIDYDSDLMTGGRSSDLFSLNQFIAADIFKPGVTKYDFLTYELTNQMIATANILFAKKTTFDFNSISKKLHLFAKPHDGTKKLLHVYRKVEPLMDENDPTVEATNIYNEKWIKRMAVEKARYQWGVNLMKYMGTVLPNGMQLNSDGIKQTAEAEIEKLMTSLHEEFELPVDIMIG